MKYFVRRISSLTLRAGGKMSLGNNKKFCGSGVLIHGLILNGLLVQFPVNCLSRGISATKVPLQDWNFTTVLEFALMKLRVEHIIICGHSDCGAIKALDNEEDSDYYIPVWLNNAKEAKDRVDSKIKKPVTPEENRERYRLIERENIRLQMEHLKVHPLVKKRSKNVPFFFYCRYFDLMNGKLMRVD